MKDIKEFIEKYSRLLPVNTSISYTEAEKRAGQFLEVLAHIAEWKHLLGSDKIKFTSVQSAVYAQEMSKGNCKTVTENKMNAEASDEYTKAREDLEQIENDLSYLKAYAEIFHNAHIFFRTMAKGESQ